MTRSLNDPPPRSASCPTCGFAFGWDGNTCTHCGHPTPRPQPNVNAPSVQDHNATHEEEPWSWADKLLSAGVFAFLGGLVFGVMAIVIVSWDMFQEMLVTHLFGDNAFAIQADMLGIGIAIILGMLLGGWFGWDLTRRRKRHRPSK